MERPRLMLSCIACSSSAVCGCCTRCGQWAGRGGGPFVARHLAGLLAGAHAGYTSPPMARLFCPPMRCSIAKRHRRARNPSPTPCHSSHPPSSPPNREWEFLAELRSRATRAACTIGWSNSRHCPRPTGRSSVWATGCHGSIARCKSPMPGRCVRA
jgi:hypothetical protein